MLDMPAWRVWMRVTLRRSLGCHRRGRTGGGRAHRRRHDRHRPAPGPDLCRGGLRPVHARPWPGRRGGRLDPAADRARARRSLVLARGLDRADPARLASAFARARRWTLGRWRVPVGACLVLVVGNLMALPLYSLLWRAGRVGGRARLGQPPVLVVLWPGGNAPVRRVGKLGADPDQPGARGVPRRRSR